MKEEESLRRLFFCVSQEGIVKVYIVEAYDKAEDKGRVEGVFGTVEKAEEFVMDMYVETTDEYTITETELDKGYFRVEGSGWRSTYVMRRAVT